MKNRIWYLILPSWKPFFVFMYWSAAADLLIAMVLAAMFGVSWNGIREWSSFSRQLPPPDMPIFVQINNDYFFTYFAAVHEIAGEPNSDGWYSFTNHRQQEALLHHAGSAGGFYIPRRYTNIYSVNHPVPSGYLIEDGRTIMAQSQPLRPGETETYTLMFDSGMKFRIRQHRIDGAVKPLNMWVIPDRFSPGFSGVAVSVVVLQVLAAPIAILVGIVGYVLTVRYRLPHHPAERCSRTR